MIGTLHGALLRCISSHKESDITENAVKRNQSFQLSEAAPSSYAPYLRSGASSNTPPSMVQVESGALGCTEYRSLLSKLKTNLIAVAYQGAIEGRSHCVGIRPACNLNRERAKKKQQHLLQWHTIHLIELLFCNNWEKRLESGESDRRKCIWNLEIKEFSS